MTEPVVHDDPRMDGDGRGDANGERAVGSSPRRRRVAPFVAGGIAIVVALFIGLLATRDPATDRIASTPLKGKAAPPITGTGFRGDAFDLDRDRGYWVVVNFFSTTCIPCINEHPELLRFAESHPDVRLVSITFDDSGDAVANFFEQHGGDWPVLVDNTGPIAVSYGVAGVPESYLVDPLGVVRVKITGGVTRGGLDELLGEGA
jgi:cytochrome c biogenesis protein CcmG/thiol:disulfide interchange protein DsbE